MKLYLTILATAALAGCSSTELLGNRAVDYNQELDYSTNVVMLSNVVRASDRLPMTYSRLGSMNYTGSSKQSPKPTIAFGPNQSDATDLLEFGFEATDSGTTDFEAQTGQEFYNGILQSLTADRVSFYRDRGWPDSILFPLFVEQMIVNTSVLNEVYCSNAMPSEKCDKSQKTIIEDTDCDRGIRRAEYTNIYFSDCFKPEGEEVLFVMDNDPEDPNNFISFMIFAGTVGDDYFIDLVDKKDDYFVSGCETEPRPESCEPFANLRPAFSVANVDGINLSTLPKKYTVRDGIVYEKVAPGKTMEFVAKDGGRGRKLSSGCTISAGESLAERGGQTCPITVMLRSPNDMVYYLGELLRAQRDMGAKYQTACKQLTKKEAALGPDDRFVFGAGKHFCIANAYDRNIPESKLSAEKRAGNEKSSNTRESAEKVSWSPMFWIEQGRNIPGNVSSAYHLNDLYSFELNDDRFWISSDANRRGTTMQFIALLNELFYLNQKASAAPAVSLIQGATIR